MTGAVSECRTPLYGPYEGSSPAKPRGGAVGYTIRERSVGLTGYGRVLLPVR